LIASSPGTWASPSAQGRLESRRRLAAQTFHATVSSVEAPSLPMKVSDTHDDHSANQEVGGERYP